MTLHLGFDAAGRVIEISAKSRKTHMHVIGSSDSGKSKFLEWMMRGDLNSRQGFCLLDPHGTLYEDVVNYAAHHVLNREVILLNLSEPDGIVGFNPFQRSGKGDVSVQVDKRITATMHAWNAMNTDQTPTLARTLKLIYTVMLETNLGLPQVAHLIDFNSRAIRDHLVDQLQTPLIQREWRELKELRAREWRDEVLSAKNRLFKFLTSSTLARFMGVPGRTIDLQQVMDQGKVLLVNLAESDDLSEENARAFGALMVSEFFECARRRKRKPNGDNPTPYYLYMDEFQNFVSLDIANMLDQVRKRGLFQILAHQRFGQLDENITEAVLVNAKIKAVFGGLTAESARLMAEELFIGKIDPMKVKVSVYQTKFWPTYDRDKVYTSGNTSASGSSSGASVGAGSGLNTTSGESFQGNDWFSGPIPVGSSEAAGLARFSFSGSGRSTSETSGTLESVADIPIFRPVPFQELSSVQYYTPEEQLFELTAALKQQYQRHCFLAMPDAEVQPMLVPFVKSFYTSKANEQWYLKKHLEKQHALPVGEIDRLLAEQETSLAKAASVSTKGDDGESKKDSSKKSIANSKGSPSRRGSGARSELRHVFGNIKEPS